MPVSARLKLNSGVAIRNLLRMCRPQVKLYTEKLLGCRNGSKANISKLKSKLQTLFPVKFENQSLEFRDIEICIADTNGYTNRMDECDARTGDAEAVAGGDAEGDVGAVTARASSVASNFEASIKLEWFCYGDMFGIPYVEQRANISVPLVRFPKLSADDTLSVNGIEKVLVSQLGRQPGIRIEADQNSIDISFLKKNTTMFRIKADREKCSALCEGREVELLQVLIALGVTKSHILRVLHDVKTMVYTNGEWCELRFAEHRAETETEAGDGDECGGGGECECEGEGGGGSGGEGEGGSGGEGEGGGGGGGKSKSKSKSEAGGEGGGGGEVGGGAEIGDDAKGGAEIGADAKGGAEIETEAEIETKTKTEAEIETKTKTEAEIETKTKTEAEAEAKSETGAEPKSGA